MRAPRSLANKIWSTCCNGFRDRSQTGCYLELGTFPWACYFEVRIACQECFGNKFSLEWWSLGMDR